MNRTIIMLLASLVMLSSCATLNKDECLTADWYQIGYEDGAMGQPESRISAHRQACSKHGVTPDLRQYQDGHQEGVISFCSPRNGFVQGQNGYEYTGICPPALEREFLDSYQAGRELYSVRSAIRNLQTEQRTNENKIEQLEQGLIDAEAALFSAATPEEERRKIYDEISNMQSELGSLEQRNKQLVVEIAQAQAQLRLLEDKYAFY